MVIRIEDLQRSRRFEPVAEDLPGFGALLRDLRIRAGLSQGALARQADVDPAYVNRLERDVTPSNPSRDVVVRFALVLTNDSDLLDELLAAAGLLPASIVEAGGWTIYRAAYDGNLRVLESKLDRVRAENARLCREVVALRRAVGPDLVKVD